MGGIFKLVVPTFIIVVIGWIFGVRFKKNCFKIINHYVLYLAFPTLIFKAITSFHFKEIKLDFFTICIVAALISFFTGLFISKRYFSQHPVSPYIMAMASAYGSTSMGLPVMLLAFSEKSFVPASVVTVLNNLPSILILVFVAERSKRRNQFFEKSSTVDAVGRILKAFLSNPLVFSVLLALMVNISSCKLPFFLTQPINMLALTAVPLSVFTLGLSLSAMDQTIFRKEVLCKIIPAVMIKNFLHPLLAGACIYFFSTKDFHDLWNISIIVMASQPIGVGVMSFSNAQGVLKKEIALAIVISLFISLFTVTFVLGFLT